MRQSLKSSQSCIYSPIDAPVSCIKNNSIKIYIKKTPDMFRCYSYTVQHTDTNTDPIYAATPPPY